MPPPINRDSPPWRHCAYTRGTRGGLVGSRAALAWLHSQRSLVPRTSASSTSRLTSVALSLSLRAQELAARCQVDAMVQLLLTYTPAIGRRRRALVPVMAPTATGVATQYASAATPRCSARAGLDRLELPGQWLTPGRAGRHSLLGAQAGARNHVIAVAIIGCGGSCGLARLGDHCTNNDASVRLARAGAIHVYQRRVTSFMAPRWFHVLKPCEDGAAAAAVSAGPAPNPPPPPPPPPPGRRPPPLPTCSTAVVFLQMDPRAR